MKEILLVIIGTACLSLAIAMRIRMRRKISMVTCAIFWITVIIAMMIFGNHWMVPGMLCNAAAILANKGTMPVFTASEEVQFTGIHVRGRPEHRLQWLCDRSTGISIGDVLLTGGLVFIIISRSGLV